MSDIILHIIHPLIYSSIKEQRKESKNIIRHYTYLLKMKRVTMVNC